MTKSLVTGGAGFIGSHVVKSLLQLNHQVVVLDDLSGGFIENVDDQAIFVNGSITDVDLIENLFKEHQFDYVYHLAAYAAEGLSHFIRKFNYENNLVGSINLINASVKYKIKTFIFTSSIAVYGAAKPPIKEETYPMPEDPYGIAKYAVEQDLQAAHEMFGLNYVVFRPHNVYGVNQNIGDKYRNVVGIFMNQLMQGKQLSVFGDGLQTRAFSHVNDVAPYIANSYQYEEAINKVFNIGSDKEYTVKELAHIIMKEMGLSEELNYLPERNEVKHAYADHSLVKKVFEIESFTSIEEGIREMAEWVKLTGVRSSTDFDNIELYENLPSAWSVVKKSSNK
jgi:UDP-glucose 4-epimerase